jgi:phosphoglycerate dehydrogenase-like enzyme
MKFNIIIPDLLRSLPDIEQSILGGECHIEALAKSRESDLPDEIESADALMVWHEITIGPQTISRLKRCKVIARYGVGFDNIDLEAAGVRGIPVFNVPDYGTNDVADHTMAMLLHLARGLGGFNSFVRDQVPGWDWAAAGLLHRLTDRCLGIIGLGRIGTAVALRAKSFGLKVVFYDPYVADGMDKALGVTRHELDELLECADIISFHCPLTEETRNMADASFFSRAKQGVVLINTARGAIVEFPSLERALRSDKVSSAGLDVLPCEPPDEADPLIRAWRKKEEWIQNRMILTPHAAFYSEEAIKELRTKTALTVRRVLNGEMPRNCINSQFLKSA